MISIINKFKQALFNRFSKQTASQITNREGGQSLVEMAIIAPILIMMLIGLFEIGYVLWGYMTLLNLDREAARFSIREDILDFQEIDPVDIGYSKILTHTLVSNSDQLKLSEYFGNFSETDEPKASIIVTHLIVDTSAPCDPEEITGGDYCYEVNPPCPNEYIRDDMILHPEMPNYDYLRYQYPPESTGVFTTRLNVISLTTELKDKNNVFNCELWSKMGSEPLWSNNSVIIVETFYEQPQLLGFPLFAWLANPLELYAQTTLRIDSNDLGRCEVLPIAVRDWTIEGDNDPGNPDYEDTPWIPKSDQRNIWNGGSSSEKGWLFWNGEIGNPQAPHVRSALLEPRSSANEYVDPIDPTGFVDDELNRGDYVSGAGGTMDTLEDELAILKGGTYLVPVWDTYHKGTGGDPNTYHIKQFARIQIGDADLSGGFIMATLIQADVDYACPGNDM